MNLFFKSEHSENIFFEQFLEKQVNLILHRYETYIGNKGKCRPDVPWSEEIRELAKQAGSISAVAEKVSLTPSIR